MMVSGGIGEAVAATAAVAGAGGVGVGAVMTANGVVCDKNPSDVIGTVGEAGSAADASLPANLLGQQDGRGRGDIGSHSHQTQCRCRWGSDWCKG